MISNLLIALLRVQCGLVQHADQQPACQPGLWGHMFSCLHRFTVITVLSLHAHTLTLTAGDAGVVTHARVTQLQLFIQQPQPPGQGFSRVCLIDRYLWQRLKGKR